ncbi:double-strand break repair protein AddB [Chelatococcus reniformis]|uniref:Double-strand break repair protein AddB n=1 Tax=Chelatococcus reniformis TaxID=1494448 RepID=A0A916TXL5_9HYPH|nr:double-strand break repair protein AddB [Chelatococcus reniformis]GGC45401.1 double-strand break repair protein AddB [Chelatococcus reniformis]
MNHEPRPDLFSRLAAPRVFTVPPGAPFLPTLASALLDGRLVPGFAPRAEPLGLARATVFLPTRRAARALADHLVAHAGVGALFLPRIVPLGDVDEDMPFGESDDAAGPFEGADAALPPPIPAAERRLTLTRLVLAWARQVDRALLRLAPHEPLLVPASPADALALAGDLERLMDHMTTQGVDWDALAATVEARHSAYFGITLAFLRIVAETWPALLAERGASDPTARRNALILAEAARLAGAHGRPASGAPMIAAGSTGSMPATARLLAAIARLPNGTVVLPGLDQHLDDTSFDLLTGGSGGRPGVRAGMEEAPFGHPQTAMARLIATIGIDRRDVVPLGIAPPAAIARNQLLSEALRPAATTELWAEPAHRPSPATAARALAGVAIVEAGDEREEALAAAIAIREALEDPRATVALVTPDRGLAERVCAELGRWGLDADDSAGRPLARTAAGRLARLVAEAAASRCAARALVALITHPLAGFGQGQRRARRAAAALEIGLLRGPEPPPGVAGLRAVLPERRKEAAGPHAPRPLRRLGDGDWELASGLIDRLEAALEPMATAAADGDLVALAGAHRQAVLAAAVGEGELTTLTGPDADALFALFDDLAAAPGCTVPGGLGDYPAFFARLAGDRVARLEGAAGDGRVRVLGLLEARLVHVDRMILGGLDEAVWPPAARTDSFINRPMAAALGLPPPERRIGQTAHDFVAALGTEDAVITRAAKRGGAPTVPSRFLQRLKALADDGPVSPWAEAVTRGRRYLDWAAALDAAPAPRPIAQPAPRPPADLVPRSLSVTEVETLVRDPYAIFAKHVLRLDPLDELAVPPGAADRGTIIHDVLGRFAERWPTSLVQDPTDELIALGREAFAGLAAYPDIAAQWWPRFERVARAFARWELARRPAVVQVFAEVSGRLELSLADGVTFTLRARADRIELRRDGGATVVDFKTGSPPTAKEVFVGFAPQLTLEAAMLRRGAFTGVPAGGGLADLLYVQANGGVPPLRPRPVAPPSGEPRTVAALIEEHLARFEALIARYIAGELPFRARPFAKYAKRYNDYDHLARVREWSLASAEPEP